MQGCTLWWPLQDDVKFIRRIPCPKGVDEADDTLGVHCPLVTGCTVEAG